MTNFKTFVAVGATMAFMTLAGVLNAQDDLDDLLSDLESEETTAEAPAEAPAKKADAPKVEEKEEAAAEEEEAADEDSTEEESADAEAEEEESAADEEAEEAAADESSDDAAANEDADAEEAADEESATEEDDDAAVEEVAKKVQMLTNEKVDDVLEMLDELAGEDKEEPEAVQAEEASEEPDAEPAEEASEEPAEEAAEEASDEAAAEPKADKAKAEDSVDTIVKDISKDDGSTVTKAQVKIPVANRELSEAEKGPDAELLANVRATEKLRRQAMDKQAIREMDEARNCLNVLHEYSEAVRHYGIAIKLLNDSPAAKELRNECETGMAEGLYQGALQEDRTGRRKRAVELITEAIEMRHPMARKQLELWLSEEDPDANKTDVSEITHYRNEEEYKNRRLSERKRLKRARQLLAQRELDRALDECELVIDRDPYNQEAIRLRESIMRKRQTILRQERAATREGMMADVDEAWRPVYAVDVREVEKAKSSTVKTNLGDDPDRSLEQSIIKRMKAMRLPTISFKPPATIIDAVDYFRQASKDFDSPELPLEQRGFNFVLKTPEALRVQAAAAAAEEADDDTFSDEGEEDEGASSGGSSMVGVPVIPMITASDITFYDALKLVCESVDYKFTVQGQIVMVMQKDMSIDELVTRSFPVLSTFLEKMGSAGEDMRSMQTSAFNGGGKRANNNEDEGENSERDWKQFFGLLGVKWPEGSSIFYVKTVGRLFVKNTLDNLAEFENVLLSLNQQVTLVEIETRFVEVCQEDLNSLGFEWLLNSDYTVGLNQSLAKALGIRSGGWSASTANSATTSSQSTTTIDTINTGAGQTAPAQVISSSSSSTTTYGNTSQGSRWVRADGDRNIGINATGGDTGYSTGQRYLSTVGNHVSGQNASNNDQFMKVNAFFGNADISMILHMLSQRSDTDLLSAPKVLTRPGEEAVMKVVTEYIYPTDYDVQLQSSSSGGNNGGGSSQSAILAVVEPQSFTMREVGVILQVTPTLTDDGNVVDLELKTDVVDEPTWKNYGMRIPFTGNSSLQSFQGIGEIFSSLSELITSIGGELSSTMKNMIIASASESAMQAMDSLANNDSTMTYYDAPMEQPFFHVREVESKVSVYPGATIVMGGLITETRRAMDDKIPFLGDIPYIGRLFRSHAEETSKRNLLIFVTTRIVDGRGREMRQDSLEALGTAGDVKAAPEANAASAE